jgi:septum formation protein
MIILASGSPRRRELLTQVGISFSVEKSRAKEDEGNMAPAELVKGNARRKALDVASRCPGRAVVGADTVVAFGNEIFGKPKDIEDARRILSRLSGCMHKVITGLAIVTPEGKVFEDVVMTSVEFADITEREIDAYVATGEPMDKAGAYAIQGKAALFITGIHGSYSNVVGLPLHALYALAEEAGVELYDHHGA